MEGTLLGLNGCQDAVTLALAQCLRGPRNPHLRRRQRELLYDMRIALIPGGRATEVSAVSPRCCTWVRAAQAGSWREPLVLARMDELLQAIASTPSPSPHRGGAGKGVLD